MKCKNCGGEIDSHLTHCPYCNTVNEEGVIFQEDLRRKLEKIFLLKPFIIKNKTPEMISKIMNRSILTLLILNFVLIALGFTVYTVFISNIKVEKPREGTYAYEYGDFRQGRYYEELYEWFEDIKAGEIPSNYTIESIIESEFERIKEMDEMTEEEREQTEFYVKAVLEGVLGLTEEEMEYLYSHTEDSFLEYDWIDSIAERIRLEMEAERE